MITEKYVPEICQGESAKYTGYIELKKLSAYEKFEVVEQIAGCGEEMDSQSRVKRGLALLKIAAPFYATIALKRVSDGLEVTTYDQLLYTDDLLMTMVEVSNHFADGIKLGNG